MPHTGQCLCGAVSYVAEGVANHFHSCHCGMCRRWSGGPGMAVNASSVAFNGEHNVGRYSSSEWAERGFCKQCGSSLFYHLKGSDDYILWLGTLDDQSAFTMAGEIYIDAKPNSYAFAGDHPRQTEAEFLASLGQPQT